MSEETFGQTESLTAEREKDDKIEQEEREKIKTELFDGAFNEKTSLIIGLKGKKETAKTAYIDGEDFTTRFQQGNFTVKDDIIKQAALNYYCRLVVKLCREQSREAVFSAKWQLENAKKIGVVSFEVKHHEHLED